MKGQQRKAMLTNAEVCERLRVSRQTLRQLMQETPRDMARPWINVGVGRRPTYRWTPDKIEPWLEELERWRVSTSETADSESAGETQTERAGVDKRPRARQRKGSGERSKPASQKDGDGSLLTLVSELDSGKA